MARPCKRRQVCGRPGARLFVPANAGPGCTQHAPDAPCVELAFDELEALRLCDLTGLHQDAAARAMGVSRATLGRILAGARGKVAAALVDGLMLRIGGGPVELGQGACRCGHCPGKHAGRPKQRDEANTNAIKQTVPDTKN